MELIKAFNKGQSLLNEIKNTPTTKDILYIWWLGQAGYLIKWDGHHILIDPYLSDSLTEKYKDTDKPHVRMSEHVIDPHLFDFIDIVTSSHNHTDHLDAATLKPLIQKNPDLKLVIPEANRAFVANRLGCDISFPIGLTHKSMHTFHGGISVHGIESAHESLEYDGEGHPIYMGYVFLIGDFCIYHSGDCVPFEGLEYELNRFRIDISFLPVNGRAPERKVSGNFTVHEACTLAKNINSTLLIPGHYDMFEFNTVDVHTIIPVAKEINQAIKIMQLGERFEWNQTK